MSQYLRNRPFLVIEIFYMPARHVRTESKGWNDVPGNWTSREQPTVVDRVSAKIMARASVIIDLTDSTLVKSRFGAEDGEQIVQHYTKKYHAMVTEGLNVWTAKQFLKARLNATGLTG